MRVVVMLMLTILSLVLTGCVALLVPSMSQVYHKDNVYFGASIGYPAITQVEANVWVSKQPDIDIGISGARYSEDGYSDISFNPYVRYWIKSGDTPFLNLGGSLLIATGTYNFRGAFAVGPSIFASIGYFGEVFSISLTAMSSVGYSEVFGRTSGYYLFGSLGLQMNLMPIRNIGIGLEICPGLGIGAATILLPALARLSLNFTF